MHSVFVPAQARLAEMLRQRSIPYVITPHGGVAPGILSRGRTKKAIYSAMVETKRFMHAAGISFVLPRELEEIRAFVPDYHGVTRWVPNPVNPVVSNDVSWKGTIEPRCLVYLGRFDVLHKGIDILVDIAKELPDANFRMYGIEDHATRRRFEQLRDGLPGNVTFRSPVFGDDKLEVLTDATMYIQVARWEAFGISVAEAMWAGLPCAISTTMHMADLFRKHRLGLVLPSQPLAAARSLNATLSNHGQLEEWSIRAKVFARTHFHPHSVAASSLRFYEQSIALSAASVPVP